MYDDVLLMLESCMDRVLLVFESSPGDMFVLSESCIGTFLDIEVCRFDVSVLKLCAVGILVFEESSCTGGV